ncbi:MAG: hypothetical protein GQ544_05400 [Candidatus Aminicenantes bacterium]|nr:hypothetical protein [Candidatus Aminicenantes bacterium]
MFKKTLLVSFVILALVTLHLSAWTVDVSGTWELTTQGRQGERTSEITIEQDGENIIVTMPGFRGGDPMAAEGTIKGNEIAWSITREGRQGEMTIVYTGTVEGDSMSGQADFAGRMTMDWSAKKK